MLTFFSFSHPTGFSCYFGHKLLKQSHRLMIQSKYVFESGIHNAAQVVSISQGQVTLLLQLPEQLKTAACHCVQPQAVFNLRKFLIQLFRSDFFLKNHHSASRFYLSLLTQSPISAVHTHKEMQAIVKYQRRSRTPELSTVSALPLQPPQQLHRDGASAKAACRLFILIHRPKERGMETATSPEVPSSEPAIPPVFHLESSALKSSAS